MLGRFTSHTIVAGVCAGLVVTSACAMLHAQQAPASPAGVRLFGAVQREQVLTEEGLRREYASAVRVVALSTHGQVEQYEAVPLVDVVTGAGLKTNGARNADVGLAVVARARDGYTVVFGLGELLATTGAKDVYLAFQVHGRHGSPLTAAQRPMRLVVPTDKRAARSAFGLTAIEVVDLGASAADAAR